MGWIIAPKTGEGPTLPKGSVEVWLEELQQGRVSALGRLHRRYWPSLVAYARSRVRPESAPFADEEDLVQAAFLSFYRALREGRAARVSDRESLVALLTTIIARKAARKASGPVLRDVGDTAALERLARETDASPLEQAMLKDCYQRYVGGLPSNLRPFAEMCLAGMTHREIAATIPCAVRTVERKMSRILHLWHELAASGVDPPGG